MKRLYITGLITGILWILLLMGIGVYGARTHFAMQQDIAASLIRFHVRANSDSVEDQQLKLAVRDCVIALMSEQLSDSSGLDESRQLLQENTSKITAAAQAVLAEAGCGDSVHAYFEHTFFPTRTYGSVTLPPGIYEAFRIDIGEAKGHNWWCVLYPPLCFADETHEELVLSEERKRELAKLLTQEEYQMITEASDLKESTEADSTAKSAEVKIRFRFLTFLNREEQ